MNCSERAGDCVGKKRYMIYDGNTLIGTYTSPEAGEVFGVSRYTISKYAYSGDRLHGRYTVKREEDVLERKNHPEIRFSGRLGGGMGGSYGGDSGRDRG